jgi:ribonuclease Z
MQTKFLGTGGYYPNESRHTMSVLIPERGILFDAGTSTFRATPHLKSDELQVFLSHSHLDHIAGLTCLLVPMLAGDLKKVSVTGEAKTLKAVKDHLFHPSIFPIHPDFEYLELKQDMKLKCGGVVKHVQLKNHPNGSTGYRIDWPELSIAYITDTVCDGTYKEFIQGVDLLIHESNFPDSQKEWAVKTGHSCTSEVAQLAKEASVKKLVLVHRDPVLDVDIKQETKQAQSIFPETIFAEDGLTLEFKDGSFQ